MSIDIEELSEYTRKLEAMIVSSNEIAKETFEIVTEFLPRVCELEEKVAKIIKDSEREY